MFLGRPGKNKQVTSTKLGIYPALPFPSHSKNSEFCPFNEEAGMQRNSCRTKNGDFHFILSIQQVGARGGQVR